MADNNTVVTKESYFSRIGSSIKGIGVGFVMFIVAFPLLFWNEGRAVRRAKTLEKGKGVVVSIKADQIDPANEGKLVHFSGKAVTADTVQDPIFQVSANAIGLVREVQMFQWREHSTTTTKKNLGGSEEKTTVYSYDKGWGDTQNDSSQFHDQNGHANPEMPCKREAKTAQNVTVGAFTLPAALISSISGTQKLTIDEATANAFIAANPNAFLLQDGTGFYLAAPGATGTPIGCKPRPGASVATTVANAVANALTTTPAPAAAPAPATPPAAPAPAAAPAAPAVATPAPTAPAAPAVATPAPATAPATPAPATAPAAPAVATPAPATAPAAPAAAPAAPAVAAPAPVLGAGVGRAPVIGDMRITFAIIPQKDVSIIAQQDGSTLTDFVTETGNIRMLVSGTQSAAQMFKAAEQGNTILTWLLRLLGLIVMYSGLCKILGPLDVLADVLPFLGSLMRMGTGLLSFLVALPCTLVTIAIAWFYYRPVLSVILLLLAAGCVALIISKRKAKAAAPTPA